MKLFEEEDLQDIGGKMKPGDDTRTVAYVSYLQFLSKLEKTQNYRIVGKFVKQKYAQAKDTNPKQAEKLKEVYYILTYYANMKDDFIDTIGKESKDIIKKFKPEEKNLIDRIKGAFTKQKGRQFSLLSDVSPHIALATKAKMPELINKSNELMSKIEGKGVNSQHIKGFHDKMVEIDNMEIPAKAEFKDYLENFASPSTAHKQTLKNLRIAGIAVAELFGPLIAKPKGYLNYLEKDVFKIKPPDAPTVPDTPARVDLDRPDKADFSRFLGEGLRKANAQENQEARKVKKEFFSADEENKQKSFFDMIITLEYHIATDFKILNNKQIEQINEKVKQYYKTEDTLFNLLKKMILEEHLPQEAASKFKQKYEKADLKNKELFRIFLEEAKEEEERIEKDIARGESERSRREQINYQNEKRKEYRKIYKEFKFVADQKEAGEVDVPNTVRLFFKKSLGYYNASITEEDNPEKFKYDKAYLMYEYAHIKAEPDWKKVRAKIAKRKLRSINTDVKDLDLALPEKLVEKYKKIANLEKKSKNIKLYKLEKQLDAWEKKSLGLAKPEDLEEQLTKIIAPYLMERIKNRKPIDNRLINMLKPLKANKRKRK